ncbi:MAG: type II toxin-antitoxin system prevent-host-death family antitoxin [Acidobacteria bacterium]|nr:type II toxin-antitoxin system prevent-host-death family antitoxin [Acidobacteriota bacterium]
MKDVVGTYEAKTKFTELLREVRKGKSFTITNRGEEIAEIIPARAAREKRAAEAVERFQEFMKDQPRIKVDIKALIEEGRD